MPVLTVVNVDHTTDQLEITGHDLVTGAGPAAMRLTGDGTDLPAPIAEVTDYWVIVVDANHVKLATSSANAMSNTPVALTTNGVGPYLLELGIPYRRARTYQPRSVSPAAAQVKSDDLNAKMDSLTALHALLTGQAQDVWTVESLEAPALYYTEEIPIIIPGARAVDPAGVHAKLTAASGCQVGHNLAGNTAPLTYPIDGLRDGDVITAWEVSINKGSGGLGVFQGWVMSVDWATHAEAAESAGTGLQNTAAPGAGWSIGESGLSIDVTDAKQYYLDVDPNANCTGDAVYAAKVWVKRPRP